MFRLPANVQAHTWEASVADSALSGLQVVEAGDFISPAYGGKLLADLGADVIKVEPPAGDYGRQMTWPIVEGTSLLFLHANRGKRSITLDLRTEEGADILRDLVRDADRFLGVVEQSLGLSPHVPQLPLIRAAVG